MSEREIKERLYEFYVVKVRLRLDDRRRSQGVAEAYFDSWSDAERAMRRLQGREIRGRVVKCSFLKHQNISAATLDREMDEYMSQRPK